MIHARDDRQSRQADSGRNHTKVERNLMPRKMQIERPPRARPAHRAFGSHGIDVPSQARLPKALLTGYSKMRIDRGSEQPQPDRRVERLDPVARAELLQR